MAAWLAPLAISSMQRYATPFLTYASRARRSERRGVHTAVPAAPMAIWRATALALVVKAPRSAPRKRSMRLIGGASPSQPRRGPHPRLGIGQIRAREGRAGYEQAGHRGRGIHDGLIRAQAE